VRRVTDFEPVDLHRPPPIAPTLSPWQRMQRIRGSPSRPAGRHRTCRLSRL